MSRSIQIVEVGPRDGLQNEKRELSVAVRVEMIRRLAESGLRRIETGAFVSPKWVPQMQNSAEVHKRVEALFPTKNVKPTIEFSALVPNERGMHEAIAAGLKTVAVFGSASEAFSQKNINCSIEESFVRFAEVRRLAKINKMRVRGYLSMCFGCPFEGEVPEARVVQLAKKMAELGVYEISIGDTIGAADPKQVRSLVRKLIRAVGTKKLAMHFHDTRGTALANILASLDLGINVYDASIGGLGGCPYSPKSTGNVATEDVVYMLHGMGFRTGIDLNKLIAMHDWIESEIGHPLSAHVSKAGLPKHRKN